MRIVGDVIWAKFLERTSRFTVIAERDGRLLDCFLANPGRLKELLVPGHNLLLRCVVPGGTKKTGFDVIGVCLEGKVVTIDSRIPNAMTREALCARSLREFQGYSVVRSEPAFGSGRFDFLLDPPCFVEVKSCTLVKNGVALFPDAPTARGRRHLLEMSEALKQGYRCVVIFVVQRDDARLFRPNSETDPEFSKALLETYSSGVEAIAYTTKYVDRLIELARRIEVEV
ncbi:Sugar fermentation stimulation protein [uncultured archaeon]|nr:Sugar fermentation stimulation protein [uncultured archaeon]